MVITRFRVVDPDGFADRVHAALAVLSTRTGFLAADLERNLDEPGLWVLVTRWANVGSYRRALQGYESKVVVVPLLSEAVDEPSAYEDPALQ
ncbi:MAG TPA: antibiotic biosynthesis monooxygenase [Microlunatus sp.]|nr:antibiotic biosynthesis monooxygenase [Microlunatus sp.]